MAAVLNVGYKKSQ